MDANNTLQMIWNYLKLLTEKDCFKEEDILNLLECEQGEMVVFLNL